jgi:hypothetical protein
LVYGYRECKNTQKEISTILDKLKIETSRSIDPINNSDYQREICKIINAVGNNIECQNLKKRINEHDERNYLSSKETVLNDITRIKEIKKSYGPSLIESTMDDWV